MSLATRSCETIDIFLTTLRAVDCGPVNRFLADVAEQAANTEKGEYTRLWRQSMIVSWSKIYIADRIGEVTIFSSEIFSNLVGDYLDELDSFEQQMAYIAYLIKAIFDTNNETWASETLLDLHRIWARLLTGV